MRSWMLRASKRCHRHSMQLPPALSRKSLLGFFAKLSDRAVFFRLLSTLIGHYFLYLYFLSHRGIIKYRKIRTNSALKIFVSHGAMCALQELGAAG